MTPTMMVEKVLKKRLERNIFDVTPCLMKDSRLGFREVINAECINGWIVKIRVSG